MSRSSSVRKKPRAAVEQTFTLDGKVLRDEALEAMRSYFMPFAGLYAAFVGKDVRVVGKDDFRPIVTRDPQAKTAKIKAGPGRSRATRKKRSR